MSFTIFDALNIPKTHPARDPLDNFLSGSACRSAVLHDALADFDGADPHDAEK